MALVKLLPTRTDCSGKLSTCMVWYFWMTGWRGLLPLAFESQLKFPKTFLLTFNVTQTRFLLYPRTEDPNTQEMPSQKPWNARCDQNALDGNRRLSKTNVNDKKTTMKNLSQYAGDSSGNKLCLMDFKES